MRRTLRALASVVGLVAAVAGLPALLVTIVGWPLPHGLPAGSEIRSALSDGWRPGERFVLGVLALLLWVLWGQLLRHLAAEVRLCRRAGAGRPLVATGALHSRGTSHGRGPSRRVAGWLVSGFMLAGPLTTAAVASTPAIPVMLHTTRALDVPTAPAPAPASTAPADVAAATSGPSYVVHTWEESRDCLWTIAERSMGDPLRWGELLELNADVRQPDGRRLADDPRHWVYPGMQLRLPAGATDVGVSTAPRPGLVATVATPPDLAVPEPPAADATTALPPQQSAPAPAPATAPLGLPVPGPLLGPPSSNGSGAAPPTTVSAVPPSPSVSPQPAPSGRALAPANVDVTDGGVRLNGRNLLGAGLLAAGVVATLDRMRRVQMRRRRSGQRIPLPGPATAGREWAARVGADHEAAELVDLGLRAMAAGLVDAGDEPPEVLGVEVRGGRLEVVVAEAPPPPAGFVVENDRWVLAAGTAAELAWAGETSQPLPALVTLGHCETGAVLVDLEGAGLTAIAGDPEVAREMVWAVAAEMANKHEATLFSLVLVGFGDALADLERVQVVDSVEEVVVQLAREASEFGADLSSEGWRSMLHARVATALADTWAPTVVLCAEPPPSAQLDRLVALTASPAMAGVAVLVVGEVVGAGRQLRVADGLVDVPALGRRLRPQRLSAEEAAAIGELYDIGRRPPSSPDPVAFPVGDDDTSTWSADGEVDGADVGERDAWAPNESEAEDAGRNDAPPLAGAHQVSVRFRGPVVAERPEVLVRVFGPVVIEVDGTPVTFARDKAAEAIAYMASHRDVEVDGERLGEALWPKSPGRPTDSLNTTTWEIRRVLGTARDGAAYWPKLVGSQRLYRIHKVIVTEHDRLVDAVKAAGAGRPDAEAALHEVLEAVRGTPFDTWPAQRNTWNPQPGGREAFEWAHAGGLVYNYAADAADAAHRLVGLWLGNRELDGARWAAAQGLKASPHNEELCRDRMMVADASGDAAGVETVWEEVCAWVGEGRVDPETVALYRRLSRRGTPPSRAPLASRRDVAGPPANGNRMEGD